MTDMEERERTYVHVTRMGNASEDSLDERYYASFSSALADIRERIAEHGRGVPNVKYHRKQMEWIWTRDDWGIWFELKSEELRP